jgi:hypothetical protein
VKLAGGCFCGAVRYAVDGEPYDRCLCHCENCRRTTGGAAVAWFSVKLPEFRITQGAPTAFNSTDTGVRQFCGRCGAQLTFQDSRYDEVDVATVTLDDPALAEPDDQVWTLSRLSWMARLDKLPELPRGHKAALAPLQGPA